MSFWKKMTQQDTDRNTRHVNRINNVEMVHEGVDQAFDALGNLLNGTDNGKKKFRWRDRRR